MSNCFFCNNNCTETQHQSSHNVKTIDCNICGKYHLDENLIATEFSHLREEDKFKLSCLLNERNLKNYPPVAIGKKDELNDHFNIIDYKRFLKTFPNNAKNILDRSLLNLSRLISTPFEKIAFKFENLKYSFFINDNYSFNNFKRCLIEEKYIIQVHKTNHIYCITLKGWHYIQELLSTDTDISKSFIAMWFDDSLNGIKEIMIKASEKAGYIAETVTDDYDNDFIMNKILNMINDSKFVIADFTTEKEQDDGQGKSSKGIRGGVYFEAGYARGIGKEVIHLCKEGDEYTNRLHFDINQIHTIFWKDEDIKEPKKLIERISEQIIYTVGKGPLFKEEE